MSPKTNGDIFLQTQHKKLLQKSLMENFIFCAVRVHNTVYVTFFLNRTTKITSVHWLKARLTRHKTYWKSCICYIKIFTYIISVYPNWKSETNIKNKYYFQDEYFPEADAQRCSVKKVFLEILQNSQENTCARVSFNLLTFFHPFEYSLNETRNWLRSWEREIHRSSVAAIISQLFTELLICKLRRFINL